MRITCLSVRQDELNEKLNDELKRDELKRCIASRRRAGGGVVAALLLAAVAACSSSSSSSGVKPVAQSIGPSGGTLASSDGAVTIVIPAGALAGEVTVTIAGATGTPAGNVGRAYEIGPTGTTFSLPATLTVLTPAGAAADAFAVATVSGGQWIPIATVAGGGSSVSASLAHLSPYGLIKVGADGGTAACIVVSARDGGTAPDSSGTGGGALDGGSAGAGGAAGTVTEFAIPTVNADPEGIAAGPDGNVWFTERLGNKIGRITPAGTITEFALPMPNSSPNRSPLGIVAGPDGALWFTEYDGDQIGRMTTAGQLTEFPLPTAAAMPDTIVAGPDGNLWFTEIGVVKIARMTTSGQLVEYAPPSSVLSLAGGLTFGSDGSLYFVGGNIFGSGAAIVELAASCSFTLIPLEAIGLLASRSDYTLWYTIPTGTGTVGFFMSDKAGNLSQGPGFDLGGEVPVNMTAGPDGNMWFTETTGIGRVTSAGVITQLGAGGGPSAITAGPDGNIWFTETTGNNIGRVSL